MSMSPVSRRLLGAIVLMGFLGLAYAAPEVAMMAAALALFVHGMVGVFRRKITTRGRSGPPRQYVGAAAVKEGLFVALIGLLFGTLVVLGYVLPRWR